MLQSIRDRATGWIAYTIIILICITFALWGVNSYFSASVPSDAATVNGVPIPVREVQRAYQMERQQQQARMGDAVDMSPFEPMLRERAVQRLIDSSVLNQTVQTQRMRISNEELSRTIHQMPQFQVEGRFDGETYRRMLQLMGFSPPEFEESYRGDLAVEQLRNGVLDTAITTDYDIEKIC